MRQIQNYTNDAGSKTILHKCVLNLYYVPTNVCFAPFMSQPVLLPLLLLPCCCRLLMIYRHEAVCTSHLFPETARHWQGSEARIQRPSFYTATVLQDIRILKLYSNRVISNIIIYPEKGPRYIYHVVIVLIVLTPIDHEIRYKTNNEIPHIGWLFLISIYLQFIEISILTGRLCP